jgi:hypothetical protein
VGVGVYFGDDRVGGLGVELTRRGPLGLELLAVAAPGRVELDEDVFASVDDGIKV